ncbi:MarR family winged helix-turn-helix transcriptional regulator [Thermoactinospora rubra]|uniref:MarR family winged helix-turn-helix transcriptional regulator n=1 Tax=Thermoactinospora rubra TaxID=1088767 RepID=UPI000A1102C2|nr:MarR family transcriptional regulator [Thermoactinospora rubra]
MLDETLTYALIKIAKMHRYRVAAELTGLGLHVGQEMLLNQLWREDGLPQSELIARLGVEPPTVTKALQRLERAGFVRRTPDPHRPRMIRVHLTEEGRRLREPVEDIWRRADEELLSRLDPADRQTLVHLIFSLWTCPSAEGERSLHADTE